MTTPHINQIITLLDGRRASVYKVRRIVRTPLLSQWLVSAVDVGGQRSEVYL